MSEQGAGGPIESNSSHIHSRSKSDNDPVPEVTVVENRSTSSEADEQVKFAHPSQDSPRRFDRREDATTPPVPEGLTRNASSGSDMSTEPLRGRRSPAPRSSSRPLDPPVTKATLSELDVTKIIHNPKLRHDINFDPELHFRPNLDGEKGKKKQDKANLFWTALYEQLVMFVVDRPGFIAKHGSGDDWCLPSLLKAVKEIIQTLVPARDRAYLEEGLNVELLMQQFNKGIADLEKMASWLSGVLKLHCAPMRDEWVDEMYNELSNGNRTNNMEELVKGMRSLLSVLEAMKLDVANHQIRCLRPVLIEDTVHFEQRFFFKKVQSGKVKLGPAKMWYCEAVRQYSGSAAISQAFGDMGPFFEALSKLILPSVEVHNTPETFLFDEERIVKLRSDMLDAVNLEVCMRLYEDLERVSRVQSTFLGLPEETNMADFNFNAPPSRPSSGVFSTCGSATSSPRNSGVFMPQPQEVALDVKVKSRELYNSLLALLHTAPPASSSVQRWESITQSLAIQIFRYTNAPQSMLSTFEARLGDHLRGHNSEVYQEVEQQFHARLMIELTKRVRNLKNLSGVGLFSVATGGRIHGPGRTWDGGREQSLESDLSDSSAREPREDGGLEDMATRVAHLGLLHWRVWSQLAYTDDGEADFIPEPPVNSL